MDFAAYSRSRVHAARSARRVMNSATHTITSEPTAELTASVTSVRIVLPIVSPSRLCIRRIRCLHNQYTRYRPSVKPISQRIPDIARIDWKTGGKSFSEFRLRAPELDGIRAGEYDQNALTNLTMKNQSWPAAIE